MLLANMRLFLDRYLSAKYTWINIFKLLCIIVRKEVITSSSTTFSGSASSLVPFQKCVNADYSDEQCCCAQVLHLLLCLVLQRSFYFEQSPNRIIC